MRKYKQTEFPDVYGSTCEAHFASLDELSTYIDKELPAWKRHLIRRHLKKCAACANQVQRLQQTDDFLRQGGEIKVSDDFLSSVMARVSEATKYPRQYNSLWSHVTRFIGSSLGWARHGSILADKLRYNIRTRSPVYIFVLTFAVFTMVGATLYQSSNDRFGPSAHALKKSQELDGEKLISFEVIQHEPPKRLLTTYLQQK
jgi:predicted anti-sigma-YlaC factor YlaD